MLREKSNYGVPGRLESCDSGPLCFGPIPGSCDGVLDGVLDGALEAVSSEAAPGSCGDVLDGMLEAVSSVPAKFRANVREDVFDGLSISGVEGAISVHQLSLRVLAAQVAPYPIECLPQRMTE